jgi:hypothetical protein
MKANLDLIRQMMDRGMKYWERNASAKNGYALNIAVLDPFRKQSSDALRYHENIAVTILPVCCYPE